MELLGTCMASLRSTSLSKQQNSMKFSSIIQYLGLEYLYIESSMGSPFKFARKYLGIAQIAIAPPPRARARSNGHSGALFSGPI